MEKLEISLGHDCNARCTFCYSTLAKNKMEMPEERAKAVLREFLSRGCKEVSFTGGEPTIRKDIFSLVKYARSLGYESVGLKTNLFMLSYPLFVEKLKESGLGSVSFSIFGFGDEAYSKATGVGKGYSYFIKALKNLESSNFSLTANILVSSYSYKDIPKIAGVLLSHNISSFCFWYISTSELKGDSACLLPSFSSFKKGIFSSIDIMSSKGIKDIKVLHIPPCVLEDYGKYYFNERQADITLVDLASSFDLKDESFSDLVKLDKCKFCDKANLCAGLRKDYYEKFGGSEITPVKGKNG